MPQQLPADKSRYTLTCCFSADLNTAQALAAATRLSRDPKLAASDLAVLVSAAEALLAVGLLDLVPEDLDAPAAEVALEPDEVARLLDERAEARRRGDFAAADAIRDRLDQIGIELRDTPSGTVWKARAAASPGRLITPRGFSDISLCRETERAG
jgi:cysteinyl-tRNA synthetase